MNRLYLFAVLLCLAGCEKKPTDPTSDAASCEGSTRTSDPHYVQMAAPPGQSRQYLGHYSVPNCLGQGCSKNPTIERIVMELRTNTSCPSDFKVQFRTPSGVMRTLWDFEGECVVNGPDSTGIYVLKPAWDLEGVKGESAVGSFDYFFSRHSGTHNILSPRIEAWMTVTLRSYVC